MSSDNIIPEETFPTHLHQQDTDGDSSANTNNNDNNIHNNSKDVLPPTTELETKFTSQQLREMLKERQNQQQIWESEVASAMATLQTQKNVGLHESLVDPEGFPRDDIDVWAVRQARHTVATRHNDLKKIGEELKILVEATFAVLAREQSGGSNNSSSQSSIDGAAAETTESIEERNMKRFEQRRREREQRLVQQIMGTFANGNGNNANTMTTTKKQQEQEKQDKLNKLWEEAGVVPVATVRDVAAHSPAFLAGLLEGDVVIAVGNDLGSEHLQPEDSIQPVLNLADFASVIRKSEGKTLRVIVQRKGNNVFDLVLVPKQWSGNGILGCGLDPI